MVGNTFFLVIEGIDGCGKSSITRKLVRTMETNLGKNIKLTFEPHDPSCSGLFIRQVLMKKIANIPAWTLALAFAVNRADHCNREIQPFLEHDNGYNRIVICDRYYLSSLVYQSTPDIDFEEIMHLNSSAITPDLTIYLTASSDTCYERMSIRGDDKELFEVNLNETKQKYIEAIDFLISRGEKIITVEADGSMQETLSNIKEAILWNSPEWLIFQGEFPPDEIDKSFDKTTITIDIAADSIIKASVSQIVHSSLAQDRVMLIRGYARDYIEHLNFNDAASLFLDYLKSNSYTLHGKLPWTDLNAYELSCTLPLGVVQRGAALLLNETQRCDMAITMLLGSQKYKSIEQMSDFLFIFDSSPSHLRTNYYEREKLTTANTQLVSPALVIIGRTEVGDFLAENVLSQLAIEVKNEN